MRRKNRIEMFSGARSGPQFHIREAHCERPMHALAPWFLRNSDFPAGAGMTEPVGILPEGRRPKAQLARRAVRVATWRPLAVGLDSEALDGLRISRNSLGEDWRG